MSQIFSPCDALNLSTGTEYAGKGIVDTVLYASRAAGLVETDSYDPAVYPFEVVEDDPEEVDVREPDHVSLSKWSILVLNNHFFLSNLVCAPPFLYFRYSR